MGSPCSESQGMGRHLCFCLWGRLQVQAQRIRHSLKAATLALPLQEQLGSLALLFGHPAHFLEVGSSCTERLDDEVLANVQNQGVQHCSHPTASHLPPTDVAAVQDGTAVSSACQNT